MFAKALDFDGQHIMFSSNATPAEEFEYAHKINATINLDDFTHIQFLDDICGIPRPYPADSILVDISRLPIP